jgi:hypothetical protein
MDILTPKMNHDIVHLPCTIIILQFSNQWKKKLWNSKWFSSLKINYKLQIWFFNYSMHLHHIDTWIHISLLIMSWGNTLRILHSLLYWSSTHLTISTNQCFFMPHEENLPFHALGNLSRFVIFPFCNFNQSMPFHVMGNFPSSILPFDI